jgi:hypothetical protein
MVGFCMFLYSSSHGTHIASNAGDQPWDIPQILPWLASIDFPAPVRKKLPPQEFDQNNTSNYSFDRSAVETRAYNDLTTHGAIATV